MSFHLVVNTFLCSYCWDCCADRETHEVFSFPLSWYFYLFYCYGSGLLHTFCTSVICMIAQTSKKVQSNTNFKLQRHRHGPKYIQFEGNTKLLTFVFTCYFVTNDNRQWHNFQTTSLVLVTEINKPFGIFRFYFRNFPKLFTVYLVLDVAIHIPPGVFNHN